MAGMMVETLFPDKIPADLRQDIRKAMHKACLGNARREGGWHGDDMWPSYSNVRRVFACSLTCSFRSPGSSDACARALWAIWSMMRD